MLHVPEHKKKARKSVVEITEWVYTKTIILWNSGRIFSEPLRGSVIILPLFTSICIHLNHCHIPATRRNFSFHDSPIPETGSRTVPLAWVSRVQNGLAGCRDEQYKGFPFHLIYFKDSQLELLIFTVYNYVHCPYSSALRTFALTKG